MLKYFRMKKNEIKVKAMLYETAATLLDNQKEITDLVVKLYTSLKDVPVEEIKNEFIKQLAEIIHEQGENNT